jgi:hypothetical protein
VARRLLVIQDLVVDLEINLQAAWVFEPRDIYWFPISQSGRVNLTHGTTLDAEVNGQGVIANGGSFRVIDQNTPFLVFHQLQDMDVFVYGSDTSMFDVQGASAVCVLQLFRCRLFAIGVSVFNIVDCNSKDNIQVTLRDCTILGNSGFNTNMIVNPGGAPPTVSYENCNIITNGGTVDLGDAVATVSGTVRSQGTTSPTNPPTGSEWVDQTAFATKVWNGAAWV